MVKANRPENIETIDAVKAPTPERELDLRTGIEIIKDYHKTLPNSPGVYRMMGAEGQLLYVGKAKSLKKRVATYARGVGHTNQITRMLAMVRSMEFTITRTEAEALLLEANQIRAQKPRYNVLLRDDKSFPYISIGMGHPSPAISKHRGPRTKGADYFGPFASGFAVTHSLTILQKAFLLRTCSDAEFASRSRPCMLYQIKRCSAPCVELIDQSEYRELVDEARLFLRGRSSSLQDNLAKQMHKASENLDYETAARLRDRIRALSSVRNSQSVHPQTFSQADVLAIVLEGGVACIEIFFFRAGQNWGNRAYFPRLPSAQEGALDVAEILTSFIGQFYQTNAPPDLILLSHAPQDAAVLEDALSMLSGSNVKIAVPQRGEKLEIVNQVSNNARQTLARKLSQSSATNKILDALMDSFDLKIRPERIEIYDNSHIQGTNAVGAMVVAGADGFIRNQYRKWTIEDAKGGDDFSMMREVFRRRFTRLNKETNEENLPDLIIVDGGPIQLNAVLEIADELQIDENIKIIAMSKGVDRNAGREEFHIRGQKPFRLPISDPVLYYLQRLRDEAHRFAIGAHRQKRTKELVKNPLDAIEGIGPLRKKSLMARFGSAKAVGVASVRELSATPHISEELAQRIYDYFQAE